MTSAWRIINARFPPSSLPSSLPSFPPITPSSHSSDSWTSSRSAAPTETFDAKGLLLLPGAIDLHTHLVGPAMDAAREMCPDEIPSSEESAWRYAELGYTTVIDAAIAPSQAEQADAQLNRLPVLDSGYLLLIDRHPKLLERVEAGDRSQAIDLIGQWLNRVRAYGLKTVACQSLAMLDCLWQAAEQFRLPHALHVHADGLGTPETLDRLQAIVRAAQGRPLHLAHIQFHAYDITEKGRLVPQVDRLLKLLWDHPNVTADLGAVMPGKTCTLSVDLRLQRSLREINRKQGIDAWQRVDGTDAAWAIQPFEYQAKNPVHVMQQAISVELALKAPADRFCLTIDHPNGGTLERYPELFSLLMSRSMSLTRWVQLTRHSPAHILGLPHARRWLGDIGWANQQSDGLWTVHLEAGGEKEQRGEGGFYETNADGRPKDWRVTHLLKNGQWVIFNRRRQADAPTGRRLIAGVQAAG